MKTSNRRPLSPLLVASLLLPLLASSCASQVACQRDPPPQQLNPALLPQQAVIEGCLAELKQNPPLISGPSCKTLHSQVCSALPTATSCGSGT